MAEPGLTFKGIPELETRLREKAAAARTRVGEVLSEAAHRVIQRAQDEFVPRETSALAESGVVDAPVFTPLAISVTMAFGRSDSPAHPYALAIHEHLSRHSPPTWRAAERSGRGVHFTVGGPKYLEIPFREEADRLPTILSEARLV